MYQTEYLRSVHTNYERILLEEKPEEQKYQYCILSRGGIKGLLPCSLRYMNGSAYLYYDITSKQNVAQLYDKRLIDREWLQNFVWSLQHIQLELGRFLLDIRNILWTPDQIFQDVGNGIFFFLYVPYYKGEENFVGFLDFLIERIDYEDETLVECTYKMYDHYEKMGEDYLKEKIYQDANLLYQKASDKRDDLLHEKSAYEENLVTDRKENEPVSEELKQTETREMVQEGILSNEQEKQDRRGIRSLFEWKKKWLKNEKDSYHRELELTMTPCCVAEENRFEEEYGQTIYIEEPKESSPKIYRLYSQEGKIVAQLDHSTCVLGKKRGEVDVVVEDASVSRVHARVMREKDEFYLEDLNSTNGTFKNGLRLQPYEKRKLEEEDEIKIGNCSFIFRSVGY